MLRIQTSTDGDQVVFRVSGRIDAEGLAELQRLIHSEAHHHGLVLDLEDVKLVNREAVEFLAACEAKGAKLRNAPAYIREWVAKQKDRSEANDSRPGFRHHEG
jgi:anti-anti-sigma regulatory factor